MTIYLVGGTEFHCQVSDDHATQVREAMNRLPRTGLLDVDSTPPVVIVMNKITMIEFGEAG